MVWILPRAQTTHESKPKQDRLESQLTRISAQKDARRLSQRDYKSDQAAKWQDLRGSEQICSLALASLNQNKTFQNGESFVSIKQ